MEDRGKNKWQYFEINEINEETRGREITKLGDILWQENGILQGVPNKERKTISPKPENRWSWRKDKELKQDVEDMFLKLP
jgi:hypothetical protein